MKLSDLIPTAEQLKLVQGVEGELLRRKRAGAIGGLVAIGAALLQVLVALIEQDYLENIGTFFYNLFYARWDQLIGPNGLSIHELTGLLVLVIGFGVYFLFTRTRFLLKESEEPFRYTFWIEPFEPISDTPGPRFTLKKDDQFHLLAHDLRERLSSRIGRLSLLDVASPDLPEEAQEALTSHIHIGGYYAIRERREGLWVIQVMPRIRIGPPSRPEALADPIEYPLTPHKVPPAKEKDEANPAGATAEEALADLLDADRYQQIVERVYSRIATEVYKQILADVKGKIDLFPTNYLRAAALFHEAKDFERSNTIDAYDYAIDLYRESTRYFDIGVVGSLSRFCLNMPVLWRFAIKSQLIEARARRGLSRSLIYRRIIAALSGRAQNTLFEIPGQLEKSIKHLTRLHNRLIKNREWKLNQAWDCPDLYGSTENLDLPNEANNRHQENRYKALMAFLTFPRDTFLRRHRAIFDDQREALFDTYAVAALAYAHLDATQKAKCFLDRARAVAPDLSQNNAPWLLAAAEIETELNQKLLLLRRATEMALDFEVAQYRLAYYSEMRLRMRNEIQPERVENVIKQYDEVLRINPGNIGALAAQGYLWWLLGDLPRARKKFEEGSEIKAIVRQTFIGDLNYGLARIAAEEGHLNQSYNFYTQAITADPGVGAYSNTTSRRLVNSYYNNIVPDILRRYETFRTTVEQHVKQHTQKPKTPAGNPEAASVAEKTLAKVRSYLGAAPESAPKPDNQTEAVSAKTLKAVTSFVLNDYGNACLNYFHRFGDYETLEQAISAFETAIQKNPENFVAYYNLHNAYGWRRDRDSVLILNCLAQAEKLAPAWPTVLITSAQSQMREIQNLLDKTKQEKEAERAELKKVEDRLKSLEEKAPQEFLEAKDTPASQRPLLGSEKLPQQPQALAEAQNKIREQQAKLENLDKKIKALQAELQDEVFRKIGKTMDQTKLSSLFEKIDYTGRGVKELCAAVIERDKLDENDIDALKVWAEVLSYNIETPSALAASEDLSCFIQHYYPQDFDTDYILYEVYDHLKIPDKQKIYRLRLRRGIKNWLAQDGLHFASLKWATEFTDFFNYAEQVGFLQKAIELEPDRDSYYEMLGNVYYIQEDEAKAIEAYRQAIEINPKNDHCFNLLGNRYFAQADYEQAAENYRKAIALNPQISVYHANLARAYRELEAWPQAIEAHQRAIELDPEKDDYRQELKSTLNAQGNAYFAQADYAQAIEKYRQAIELDPDDDVLHSNLALGWENLGQPGQRIEALDQAMAALRNAQRLRYDKDYEARLERLEANKALALHFGEKALDWYPVVTPITVEVAGNLIPYVEAKSGGLEPALSALIGQMRERLDRTLGVHVPGIRFRGNENDMPPGSYLIMINEIPLVMGTISTEKRLFPGSAEALAEIGVSGQEAINPVTGEAAVWVSAEDFETVEKAGLCLWQVIEYMMRHLEAVLRQNLAEFVGHQELTNMLRNLPAELYQPLKDDPAGVSRLTSILKGLLNEQTPITPLEKIVAKFNQLKPEGHSLPTTIEMMRALPEIRPGLAGNNNQYSFYRLGQAVESQINEAIYREGSQPVLAMEPKPCQDILSLIREKLDSQRHVAILVENEGLRSFVRELIKLEWPLVPVLARAELMPGLDSRIVGEIGERPK